MRRGRRVRRAALGIGQKELDLATEITYISESDVVVKTMHTVASTKTFDTAAEQAGLTEDEMFDIVTYLAENPQAGEEMVGTGGCRKLRFPVAVKASAVAIEPLRPILVRTCRCFSSRCFRKTRRQH